MDINDWWHVVTNGKEFVGKRLEGKAFEGAPEGRQLVDVQECVTQTGIVSDERNLPRPRSVVMTFPSRVKKLQIPTGALWVPISGLQGQGPVGEDNRIDRAARPRAARAGIGASPCPPVNSRRSLRGSSERWVGSSPRSSRTLSRWQSTMASSGSRRRSRTVYGVFDTRVVWLRNALDGDG